jgi:phosphatidate cytidylyltransferase
MDDELFPRDERPDDTNEGVRIIGAEEAEKAIEREDVARRLPHDAPRYGDRPDAPPGDGPRPAIRFPLSGAADPSEIDRPPVMPAPEPVNMPHWTEPATGEVPAVLASGTDEEADDLDAWSSFSTSQPRWRGEGSTDFERDEYDDFSRLADEETRVGALDPNRPDPDEFFEFEPEEPVYEPAPVPSTRAISSDPRRARQRTRAGGGGGFDRPTDPGRDLQQAVAVGAGIAAVFLLLAKAGPKYVMVIATVVIALAAVELFTALRRAGYRPATLLGISVAIALPLASYWKGEAAYPLVLFLTGAFSLIWYLAGAGGDDSPVLGVASTMLAVGYVVVLGSFSALILTLPDGIGILYGAILTTVGYDVGAFFVGRSLGTRPMSDASPNKTFEGLAGGWIAAILAAVVIVGLIHPWDDLGIGQKALFGLAAAVAATLGDLCESVLKRDLGVKDMGTLLPGHGGVLDRFDAMLFVLPATYYAARILIF